MHRCANSCWVALLVVVGCEAPAETDAAPPAWVYPPSVTAWPIGSVAGTLGRSQAPQLTEQLGISGGPTLPLRLPTPWPVPSSGGAHAGDGPARAVVYGLAGDAPAVELIDIDGGHILWRDTSACAAPVVGVTDSAIVCADAKGTRAIGLDGKPMWNLGAAFIAMTGERVVVAGAGEAVIIDATRGNELARVKLPQPVVPKKLAKNVSPPLPITVESIIASCGDAGRELFAYGQAGQLVRIAERAGGPTRTWSTPLPTVVGIDACDGATVLVTTASAAGTSLVALSRETGQPTGTIDGVRGFWPARDGSARLEISTSTEVAIYPRDLAGSAEPTTLPVLEELLARRGDLRLVRATKRTAALLDAHGVRAYVPLAHLGAVLGDHAMVAASWLGSPGEIVHRIALPERYSRHLRVPPQRPPLALPAELRDLPQTRDLDTSAVIANPDGGDIGKYAVGTVALDPIEARWLYASMLEHPPDDVQTGGVARLDLASRTWSWYRSDGCGAGVPIALAVGRELVACAARSSKGASVYATTREGASLWQWRGNNVDAIAAAADVVLVYDADRLHVLDGRNGRRLATWRSDDGAPMRAAALDIAGMAMVVVFQRGLVMARLPRVHMVPAWTLAIGGVVDTLVPAGDGLLVALEDGDAYRVDGRTGDRVAIPGLDQIWNASGDAVTGQAPGGPVPSAVAIAAPPASTPQAAKPAPRGNRRRRPPPARDPYEDPPVLPTPWSTPISLPASWQYTIYELTGALRARNDYALESPITPAPRGPGDSPFVVQFGPGLRELLVVEPRRGDPVRRLRLPDDAAPGTAFATLVDGKPVVGTLLQNPLRAVVLQ